MASDYGTMFLALLLATQGSALEWNHHWGRGVWTSITLAGTLPVLMMMPWIPVSGLRVGWCLSGGMLCLHAWRGLGRHPIRRIPLAVLGLDAAGSWVALMLSGGSPLAIGAGAVAGAILPAALGPRAQSALERLRPLEVILLGAVGCRALLKGAFGTPEPSLWPLGLLAVPWLIAWDWHAEHASIPK
ncbi:MAG: hypothetical protein C7B45_02060 [Sulfobacillus acidophilus]|uniref:Uncharacterized protein n=1 Tax=Sulfobacillus acidophilus TaxID=53633 RepID=A0A2T2WNJ7_9FIRM|nr:MAG: hypothetical protein C7B45_02060 [Sulfobacillus acidophilus]